MHRTTSFPEHTPTAAALIRHAAAKHGSSTFAVLGDRRLTYADAEAQSALLARGLLASGVGKGTRVGLLAPNGPDWIIGWLAASRIGAVVSMLNTYYLERELGWILRHADVQLLLTVDRHLGHDYLDRLEGAAPDLAKQEAERIFVTSHPFLRSVWVWGEGAVDRSWARPVSELSQRADAVTEELLAEAESEVTPADPMIVVYSSGSTADPKGAIHSQGAVVRHAHNLWQFRDLVSDDTIYTPMPLFWVGGLSYTLIAAMHAGATLVFEDQFEPGRTLELIERERVTQVMGWPHMSKALTDHPSYPDRDLSSVRGGTLAALLPQGQDAQPRANSLGMTETLGPHTIGDLDVALTPKQEGTFGKSVPGVEHKIVDPVTGEDLPVGQLGELWLRGYSLMLGLHKQERADVFTADGWYRTGDGGYFDEDGHFYFKGRMGDQIKSAGMNITPREVELVLEGFDEVTLAFVTGIPHLDRGEDVVAAVVLGPGMSVDADELRVRMKAEIASYKVPRYLVTFADQLELPWLDSGKVDRRKLTSMLEARFREPG